METRRYKTAFTFAKIAEIMSFAIIVIGGVMCIKWMEKIGILFTVVIMIFIGIWGFSLVFISQLTLIFIDTEHNIRQVISEIRKTNSILGETLGIITNNLNKLVERKGK